MPEVSIRGIVVNFPKDPYECQMNYMEANIRAISTSSNALLESPTGTGKTLSLLCSTLAWHGQTYRNRKPMGADLSYNPNPSIMSMVGNAGAASTGQGGLIIYASRTHSQISQVVSELKSTVYRPKMTVLGSRDQLCIHERVSKMRGGALNHACNVLSAKRGCVYKNNLDHYAGPMDLSSNGGRPSVEDLSRPLMDIEELVNVGRQDRVCPYFYSRDTSASSEMVLLPYNYLLDSNIRKTLKISWQDAVVIFDEGHNLERVASDAASFVLTSTELAECITNLQAGLVLLHEEAQLQKLNKKQSEADIASGNTAASGKAGALDATDSTVQRPKLQFIMDVLTAVFNLESALANLPLSSRGMVPNTVSTVMPGKFLRDLFTTCGILPHHADELRKCANMLMEAASDSLGNGDASTNSGTSAVMSVTVPKIMDLASAVDRVLGARGVNYDDYKVYVCEEEVKRESRPYHGNSPAGKGGGPPGAGRGGGPNSYYNQGSSGPSKRRVIHYWCFSPGIAMEELKALGVRSIILTSGTLSPMAALRDDMKLPFPVQLENPHVIGGSQMWVGAVSSGPRGQKLNSTFNNRDSAEYKDELGWSILQICLTMAGRGSVGLSMPTTSALPTGPELRGGILVFYPSYTAMEGFLAHWESSGMLAKMRNIVGAIVVEPRGGGKSEGKTASGNSNNSSNSSGGRSLKRDADSWGSGSGSKDNFMTSHVTKKAAPALADGGSDGVEDAAVKGVIGEFEAAMQRYGGCLLMAVCRGKVSEGIDFTDSKGRCVIITGIPFAPFMDPWVILKKDYLDGRLAKPAVMPVAGGGGGANNPYNKAPNPYGSMVKVEPGAPANPYSAVKTETAVKVEPKPNMWSAAASTGQSTGYYGVPPAAPVAVKAESGYPPMPPPPTTASSGALVKSGSTNSLSSVGSSGSAGPAPTVAAAAAATGLSGQNWYNQSASRAINQCLGRVIRHRKDWGAVFLLDDRFLGEAQSSQLSGWVRPSLKKLTSFNSALHQFRGFLSTAMNDQSLRKELAAPAARPVPSIPLQVHPNPRVNPNVPRAEEESAAPAVPLRVVTIDQRALQGATDNSFIDPQLLLTQPPTAASVPSAAAGEGASHALFAVKKKTFAPGESNLANIIDTLKRAPPTAAAKPPPAVPSKTFGLSSASAGKDFTFAPSSSSSSSSSSAAVVDLTEDPSENTDRNKSQSDASAAKAKPRFGLSQQAAALLPAAAQGSKVTPAEAVKSLLSSLKGRLAESSMRDLRLLIEECKTKNGGDCLRMISQAKWLVDRLLAILISLPREVRKSSMMGLSVLFDASLQSHYSSLVTQACANSSILAAKVKSEPATSSSSSSSSSAFIKSEGGSGGAISRQLTVAAANSYGHIDNEEVLNRSSKKARQMLTLSQGGGGGSGAAAAALLSSLKPASGATPAPKKPDFLSQLRSIDAMELTQRPAQTKVSALNKNPHARTLQCVMCQEVASSPAAARCGHVSCEKCWKQWLGMNQTCPICRKPASEATITRVIVKSD